MSKLFIMLLPILMLVTLFGNGCSLLGYAVGSEIDKGASPVDAPTRRSDLLSASTGDRFCIQAKGQNMRELVFLELVQPDEERILENVVDAGQESASDWGIYPGDRIGVQLAGGEEDSGVLLGATTTDVWFERSGDGDLRKVPFSRLISLHSGEVEFTDSYLRKLIEGKIPLVYDVRMTVDKDTISIPARSIVRILRPTTSSTTKGVMTGIGAAIDITLILLATGALAAFFIAIMVAGSS